MRVAVLLVVPAGENVRIQEFGFLDLRFVNHLAFQGQTSFLESRITQFRKIRGQARSRHLIDLTAGFGAADAMRLAELRLQESDREGILGIDKRTGIPLRTDKGEYHRTVPKDPYPAPTGGHHIKLLFIAGTYQHPLLTDKIDKVLIHLIWTN